MKICLCVGTRPNFIKAAPLIRAFKKYNLSYRLVHTGQHYDYNISGIFFEELNIPKPNVNLAIISKNDSPIEQIAHIMQSFQAHCIEYKPDVIVVLGDVSSTLACALVAKQIGIKLAHIEAGERCGDNAMLEEINRKMIDSISDYLFCASENSLDNLLDEGIGSNKAYLVGNTMIDQLKYIKPFITTRYYSGEPYAVLTLHRAENVDDLERLSKIYDIILKISKKIKIVFPCHPRTKKQFEKMEFMPIHDNLIFRKPYSYLEFMKLICNAKFVLTDSGGLQIETSYLNVPCITLRDSTEWLETISHGANVVTDIVEEDILKAVNNILRGHWKQSKIKDMPLHDGKAAERIAKILKREIIIL